jgi:hypothetical protein
MGLRRGNGDGAAPTTSPGLDIDLHSPLMAKAVYVCFLPLFLPFGVLSRHGSFGGGTGRVARTAPPSKRDTKERRE